MRRLIYLMLIVTYLICFLGSTVSAAEFPDWDTVDWKQYDWGAHPEGTPERADMIQWLYNEASLKDLFSVTRYCASSAFYELDEILNTRFIAEPEGFLIALDQYLENVDAEKERLHSKVLRALFSEMVLLDHNATVRAIEGCRLSSVYHPGAVALLNDLIRLGEEELGLNINNPKTGDPVAPVIGLFLASGLGAVCLAGKRKNA